MPATNNKPTILLLSDDLRMNSGIATMSRELVLSTVHKYNWVQLAGAINHPEKGKAFDLSQSTNDMKKMKDAYVKVYPVDGYGNDQSRATDSEFCRRQDHCPDQHGDFGRGVRLPIAEDRFLPTLRARMHDSNVWSCFSQTWQIEIQTDRTVPQYPLPHQSDCDAGRAIHSDW